MARLKNLWVKSRWICAHELKKLLAKWGLMVVFLYCMRRLECATCGIIVETVPWSTGKSPLTTGYSWSLLD